MNEVKIWGGLFTSDSNKGFFGQVWEIASRFTWQLPQTLVGYGFAQLSNYAGQVDKVGYKGGATVLGGNNWGSGGAVTLGSYIMGSRAIAADPNNSLFQHEYGHYLQSQSMGLGYLSRAGIPSLMSANKNDGNHKFQPSEQDANRRAFMYFNKNTDGFYQTENEYVSQGFDNIQTGNTKGWNFYKNPLDVNHTTGRKYYDYSNPSDRALVNSLSLSTKWYDYAAWLVPVAGTVGVGIANGIYYNKHRVK